MMQVAPSRLSDELLSELSDFLVAQTGLYFPQKRWGDLERGLEAAALQFGKPDVSSCSRWLLSAPLTREQIEVLSRHLTVGETYFYREKQSLDIFESRIIPDLLNKCQVSGRTLRIWCAGCSTGEEAYTIAMILDRIVGDTDQSAISILATDINPIALGKARSGIYGEWSFREMPDWIRSRYFTQTNRTNYEILPRIRSRVHFSYLNLVDDIYPSTTQLTRAVDVIFCRNVLMYFTAEQARKVINHFHDVLGEGGWLIVGAVETSHTQYSRYSTADFPGSAIYRKRADSVLSEVHAARPCPNLLYSLDDHSSVAPFSVDEEFLPSDAPLVNVEDQASPPSIELLPVAPDDEDVLCNKALTCANQGRLDEAVLWCNRAIEADKFNPAHMYLLSTIQQERGQYDAAFKALTRAIYLEPDFVLAHFSLGNQCLQFDRRAEAKRHFRNAHTLLSRRARDELLPLSDGLTVGQLIEIITALLPSISEQSDR